MITKLKTPLILSLSLLSISAFAQCKQNIHLTFDDGPLLGKTNKVFDALEKHHVKATFFINTHYINSAQVNLTSSEQKLYAPIINAANNIEENKKRRWLLKRMKDAGHKIGSHGFGHFSFKDKDPAYPNGNLQGDAQKKRNIDLSSKILKGFMTAPYLFRLPYGKPFRGENAAMRERVNDHLSKDFDINLGWNTDSNDWRYERDYNRASGSAKESIRRKFIKEAADAICQSGGVTVLHDIKNITGDSLDGLISEIKRRGGEFVDFAEAAQDPKTSSAFETLTPTGSQYCEGPQRALEIAPKAQRLANNGVGDIIEYAYPHVAHEYSTYERASNAIDAYTQHSKCVAHANRHGKYEVRCQNHPQLANTLNVEDYPKAIGSFRNLEYANNALETAKKQGRDCEIFPIITAQGIPFNRVACK